MNAALQALADDPQMAPLWAAIHDRLCTGVDPADVATVTCDPLPRAAVAMLSSSVGSPGSVTTAVKVRHDKRVTVPVRRILDALDITADELAPAAVHATGQPIVDRSARSEQQRARRDAAITHARTRLAATPAVADAFIAAGVRDGDNQRFIRDVDVVAWCVDQLPAQQPLSRQKLAHHATVAVDGTPDPHALDRVLGDRVLLGAAQLLDQDVPVRPAAIRRLWDRAGVHPDVVSSTVLTRSLRADGDGLVDRRLNDAVAVRAPVTLTWWDLDRSPPTLQPGMQVTVVENPSVVADVLLQDAGSGPLVCTSGQLTAVDDQLLQMLTDAGAQLTYVGDRDAPGISIAGRVRDWYGADLLELDHDVLFEEHDAVTGWLAQRP